MSRAPHLRSPLASLLLAASLTAAGAAEPPSLSPDTSWQHLRDKSGVALYSRARPGSGIREFRGIGLISAPPAAVQRLLEDVQSYPLFMPYVAEARLLAGHGPDIICYQRLSLPFIANRDYTVRIQHGITHGPGGSIIYLDSWQTDNQDGPPPHLGVVRVRVNEGSWLLQPAGPSGAQTLATYQIYTDTGGALPAFIANRASQVAIPRVFEAIRSRAGQVAPPAVTTPLPGISAGAPKAADDLPK